MDEWNDAKTKQPPEAYGIYRVIRRGRSNKTYEDSAQWMQRDGEWGWRNMTGTKINSVVLWKKP